MSNLETSALASNLDGSRITPAAGETAASARMAQIRKLISRYLRALSFLVAPVALTFLLRSHPDLYPLISLAFVIAVSAAAWWYGAWAGILTSFVSIPALTLVATNGQAFLPQHVDLLGLGMLCFISVLVSRVATNRKRIEAVLRSANEQLEVRVRERTAELQQANTAIRKAHTNLKQQEEQFRTLANAIPQLSWMTDNSGGNLWCNDRLIEYTGLAAEQLLDRGWELIHAPDQLPAVVEKWDASLRSSEPFEMEFPLRAADGSFRWFLTRIIPVADENGEVIRWFGAATDIDELKRSREVLLESEQKFRAMADSAPVMIWISNIAKAFIWFNKPWLDFTGLDVERQIAQGWLAGIHPDDRQRCLETYVKAFNTRTHFVTEYRRKRRDGIWRWVLSHGVPHYGGASDFLGYIGSCIDIHDRKEMEENLRRANNDLQQFAYSASHDLQEPIRTVAIYGQLLKKRYGPKLDETGETFLEYLTTAAQRMENLVQDLLSYTRTGDAQPSNVETDANCDLKAVLEGLAAAAVESRAEITSDLLPVVEIDSIHLQQLLQNLIGNAIKYRGDRPPRIHVSAREENAYWLFSVQDNGIGIDPAYKERIFGIFKRLHTNDKYSGTGIGLAICQRIVERYRGRIWVESEPGSGSIFYFTIPRRLS